MNDLEDKAKDIREENRLEISERIIQLQKENNGELKTFQKTILEQIRKSFLEIKNENEKSQKELKSESKESLSNYQSLLKSYNENLQSQIENLKKQFEADFKLINKEVEGIQEENKVQFREHSNQLKSDILKHNAEICYLKGNFNIALMAYINYANFIFDLEEPWVFKYAIRDIKNCLAKVKYIYSDESEGLSELVKIASGEFPEEIGEMKELYKDFEIHNL